MHALRVRCMCVSVYVCWASVFLAFRNFKVRSGLVSSRYSKCQFLDQPIILAWCVLNPIKAKDVASYNKSYPHHKIIRCKLLKQLLNLMGQKKQTFNPSDPDCVDRLLQCTRQAVPLFSVSSLFYIASIFIMLLACNCVDILLTVLLKALHKSINTVEQSFVLCRPRRRAQSSKKFL